MKDSAPPPRALCAAIALEEGSPKRFDVGDTSLIALRVDGTAHVYANRCPHRGTELDWMPGRFLDASGRYLQCATHGALFRIDTGQCIAGPCRGQSLLALPCHERDGWLILGRP